MRQLATLLVLMTVGLGLCGSAGASEFEIANPEEAYLRMRERLVYIEATAIPSHLACSPTVKRTGKISKGTGYLLNGQYVITAFHVVDVKLGYDEKHCFVVYREGDRAAAIVGTPRYLPGSTEPRLRLGDQDVAIFQLVTPVRGLEDCPPLIDTPPNAGNKMFLVGYRADEINIDAGRAIGQARKYQQTFLANCEKIGVCEMSGLIPGGHSGSPVIDAREQLVGIVKGDEASTGTTFIEPVLALRSAIGSVCSRMKTARVPGLELVDLSFAKRVDESFPVLDLKVRNTGNVAYIKRAVFNVQKVWQVKTGLQPGNICASWNYEVLLPILGKPNPVVVRMSQEVKSGSTDRFTFTLGNDAPPGLEKYAFLVDVTLLYDEDDKVLQLPKLFFLADSARNNVAATASGDFRTAFLHNLRIVDELGPFSGVMNEDAQNLITRHSERIVPAYLERLSSTIPERRKAAAAALAMLGYRAAAALTALQKIAGEDKDEEVRKAARAAEADIRRSIDNGGGVGPKAPLVIDPDQILAEKDNCIKPEGTPDTLPLTRSAQPQAEDLFEKGEFDAAIAKATQAIAGGDLLSRFTRGRAYLATNRNKEAVADFTSLIELHGDYYDWNRANRALGYFRLGRIAEARADYDKAVAMRSGRNEGILAARGSFLVAVGERTAGIADYRAAIAIEPGEVGYYADLAEALVVDDQYSAALKVVVQMRELASEQSSRRSFLTIAELIETTATLCSGGQRPDAKERLRKQIAENSKPAWNFAELDRWIARTQCRVEVLAQIRDLVGLLR